MSVKKYMITIIDDDSVDIDSIHKALEKVTDGHLSVWNEATQKLRTTEEGRRK